MSDTRLPSIVAGIVTHQPELVRLEENIDAIRGQVDEVVIFDNGSAGVDDIERMVSERDGVSLLRSAENRGIAYALNRLAEHARARGARAIVTLDQDSVTPPGMVDELRAVLDGDIGVVTPLIIDRNKSAEAALGEASAADVDFYSQPARKGAITSGSLVLIDAWAAAGGYDELFFIDYVDYDFNQRVFDAGYRIARANRATLLHEVGRAAPTWLRVPRRDITGRWKVERFYSFGHSPFRCYYKARNRILFTRKHGRKLGVTHEGVWQLPQQIVLTLLFESQRAAKLSAFARGIRDGVRQRLPDAS